MQAKVKNIVDSFKTKISILQVLFEALSNSLEANAHNIKIVLHQAPSFADIKAYDSFSIIDDGDGFTKANIDSFLEYLSTYKLTLGCKGVGRFTWLKVFDLVNINSVLSNSVVDIHFSLDFDEKNKESLNITPADNKDAPRNKTTIDFTRCKLNQNNYVFLPLSEIRQTVLNTFAIKLFLLNEKGFAFNIEITDDTNDGTEHRYLPE